MKKNLLAVSIMTATLLSACGGGGGGSSTGSSSGGSASTITGTAATGKPIANATVNAYNAAGQCGTATTDANGNFSMNVSKCSGDTVLDIPYGANYLYSLATSQYLANGSVVNITPWSSAILNGVLGNSVTAQGAQAIAKAMTATLEQQIATASKQLVSALPGTYGISSGFDPMHSPFTANSTGFDAVLDNTTINNGATITVKTNSGGLPLQISSDGTVTQISLKPTGSQQNADYIDINYQQPVDGSTTTVHATDSASSNANGQGGNQAFPATPIGSTGLSTPGFYTTTPDNLNTNYYWGPAAIQYVNQYFSNPQNPYMAGATMVCQQVPGNGISGTAQQTPNGNGPQGGSFSNLKSTDVLVTSQATRLTQAAQLANLTFGNYYEDCSQGDTLPATINTAGTVYNQLQFDANGNLTVTTTNGGTSATPQTFKLTAAQVTSMLNGTPQTIATGTAGVNGYTTFNAYTFTSAYGATKYLIVEHGGSGTSAGNISRGYVGIWTIGN